MTTALKWKLALGFLLVFLAGGTVGALLVSRFWWQSPYGPRSRPLAERMMDRFNHELALTPEQAAKIRPIVEQNAAKLESIRAETGRRVRETFDQTHQQISAELTPEQRRKLATMEEQHRRRHGRHHAFGPPRRQAPPAARAPVDSPPP